MATLNSNTAQKYALAGGADKFSNRIVFGQWGEVNFEALTVKDCDRLAADGFPYLKAKPEKAAKIDKVEPAPNTPDATAE